MTIIEASNILWKFYSNNSSICLPGDFSKIIPVTETKEVDLITLKLALKEFEEAKIVKYYQNTEVIEEPKREYWILNKSLSSFDQTVTLSAITSDALAQIINKVCEKLKSDKDLCDPKSITEKDIQNLIMICNSLAIEGEKE